MYNKRSILRFYFLDDVFLTIYNLIIIIYDLNKEKIDDKKLLKNLSSITLKSFIEKLI